MDELGKVLMALVTPAATAALTAIALYLVGRFLTDHYNEQKKKAELALVQATQLAQKQRELQLAAAARFYELYGEFFAVWKAWSAMKDGKLTPTEPEEFRTELFDRIAAAEGELEAVLVRIATEFRLKDSECEMLGKFRQGYQSLREAIRDNQDLYWRSSKHPSYAAFKRLACTVASLLARQSVVDMPQTPDSVKAHEVITSNDWEKIWMN